MSSAAFLVACHMCTYITKISICNSSCWQIKYDWWWLMCTPGGLRVVSCEWTGCYLVLSCIIISKAPRGAQYHANGGGGSWHTNRRTSDQLSFEGSWISCSTTTAGIAGSNHWLFWQQMSSADQSKMPLYIYCPEFVSMICSGPVVRSHQTNLICTCPVTIL